MTQRRMITIDGNEAVASVAYRTNEVIAIYPITPASPMGEFADAWSAQGKPNVWGDVPSVIEMQSEGGAAGTAHGALQAGSLTTTFTASQGLLLKIPNLYKIAGELTPFSMHVAARTLATHALSIFCDHSDVMACRQIGCALLCSGTVQEAHDFALISQAATLRSRIPFLHFFDGFRTSHEVTKIEELTDEDLLSMMDEDLIRAHRERALTPDRPVIRGTAQNPDTFFQAREACNTFYNECPGILQQAMDQFAELTGRRYRLFDYHGHPEADRVLVLMGSAAEAAHETADWLNSHGEKVGILRVRLYRPFSIESFVQALPTSVEKLCILDRTKEPGAPGDPLYLDVVTALHETATTNGGRPQPQIIAGRYGLSSKEFNPACVKAIYDELTKKQPHNHFTVGIVDDVTHTSLPVEPFDIEPPDRVRAVFFGLGADGTVSANKNSIKIIGEETDNWAQGYFVYDSKKSGAMTISHLRFGKDEIRSKGHLPGLPPVQLPGTLRGAGVRRPGGDLPAQLALPGRRDLGPPAARGAGAPHRQEDRLLGHRRLPGGPRDRHGRSHQHHHADLLFRALRSAAQGRGHRRDQEGHPEDLRQEGTGPGREELRRRGCGSGPPSSAPRKHRTSCRRSRP